ncbi:DUF1564 domain-containing protein [Leptospira sp. WS92.C1]
MGILLLNSDYELRSALQENHSEVVTLLIPSHSLLRLSERERRNLPKRLPSLLVKYGKYLTSMPRLGVRAGKTLYQSSPGKGEMFRINARVSTGSWAFLGALAHAHGVSRCYLFNYLLWMDRLEVADSIVRIMNEGAPTFHRYYRYILHLDVGNNKIIRTLECDPAPYFTVLDYRDWFDH